MPTIQNQLVTITCPQCGQSLPGMAQRCQFCGTDVSRVPRSAVVYDQMRSRQPKSSFKDNWKEIAYNIMVVLWLLSATYQILQGLHVIPSTMAAMGGTGEYMVVVGVIDFLIGIGLLAQNDFVMYFVRFRCIGGILWGLFGLVFASAIKDPTTMALSIVVNILYIAFTGFQIYLLSEFSDT